MNQLAVRNKQILDFVNSSEYKELTTYYSQPSIFNALGVSRHENTHSNFLAWLLTPKPKKNNHNLGEFPLRKLLEALAFVCNSLPHAFGKIAPNILTNIITSNYTLSDIVVEREKYIDTGRLDIYISGTIAFNKNEYPLIIVVENKVESLEHDSQTERYQTSLKQSLPERGLLLSIYLTPLNNRKYEALIEPECVSKKFIQLNYQYLSDYVITPCYNQAPEGPVKRYLDDYLFTLGLPDLQQKGGDIIMAISKEERDLLLRFWDKHKELLIAAMLTISDSDFLDEEEQDTVQKASLFLANSSGPDKTKYTWNFLGEGRGNLPKSQLVLEIITHYVTQHPYISFEELKKVFPDKIQGPYGVIELLNFADASNFKNYKRYYTETPIRLSDCEIAVCNQWHKNNIINFIATAEKHGYIINSTE